jgi:hypothetical protein
VISAIHLPSFSCSNSIFGRAMPLTNSEANGFRKQQTAFASSKRLSQALDFAVLR